MTGEMAFGQSTQSVERRFDSKPGLLLGIA